jgi:hypothetical protein
MEVVNYIVGLRNGRLGAQISSGGIALPRIDRI